MLPRVVYTIFTLQLLQSSAQKYLNAENTALLYYIEVHQNGKMKGENGKLITNTPANLFVGKTTLQAKANEFFSGLRIG